MSVDDHKAAVQRAVDRWNAGDLEGYLELYDPQIVLHNPQGPLEGKDAVRQFFATLWAAVPSSRLTIDDALGEGEKLAGRYTIRGIHTGDFNGVPPTGKQVQVTGITILRFERGKVVERWNEADFLGLLQQFGALPPASQAA